MIERFYDDDVAECALPASIFLAGPTSRGVLRTRWRAEALEWLTARGFAGTVLLPEFRDSLFDQRAPQVFGSPASPVPGMRAISHNILRWETTGIERATVVLFWMPFCIGAEDDPESLPGFTTRAEVARELARDPRRVVLGMPDGALSGAHIRYHAHHAGVPIQKTLHATLSAALSRASP
ncbi:MAG: hypothetical protein ACXWUG_04825 [Polyangiales bacterium]